ncbi:hypothetical protein GXB81_09415 [Paraburkholderia sp. Ac-20336]|uniref:hypothetical protein n=1 Tax=Burkholderiaceae TaxID=119060 RepID=UPI001420F4A0|nr:MULTISPECIES: hypothetical protein [Burkholderiaceae]MBN3803272.1 hypothetical protein [Paraburkholderia sp. Ac-20336]NIF53780.1 hypothetical protein [Burkholderia sp. Ax-1724]NIF77592.1 hypothetical protein [Paraburkholderia sp. Cy-641]
MDWHLETGSGIGQQRKTRPAQNDGLAGFHDDGTFPADDDDVHDTHNIAGFIELFYLWRCMNGTHEASMSRFELSATRLVAL